uniref:Bacterial toxin 44 domain-containing protein n=1 Tax=Paracidobacterium acidisoli TaxID=2303751 RepID=A0A372IIN4_9BACT
MPGPAQNKNCSVPPAPSGVSVNTNIKFANVFHIFSVANIPVFYELVRGKGPMDYKQQAQNYSDGYPIGSPYADFGNFNYGAVGAAFGIPQSILLRAAGYAQGQAGTSSPEWGNWKGGPPYGDDPNDQAQIMDGYNYYQAGCYKHN